MLKVELNEENIDTLLSKNQIPIIDLDNCGTEKCPVKSVFTRVAEQLSKALSENGLAFIVNHGISEEKLKTASKYLDDFCELPTDIKKLYSRKSADNHGYVEPGEERFNRKISELRHTFNICRLGATNLPDEPLPGFADHVDNLAKEFQSLASFLLQTLAFGLELPQSFFIEKHSHMLSADFVNVTTLRFLYYPPIAEDHSKGTSSQPLDNVIRCGAHCDYGTLTLLAQDSEGGLEVQLPGSEKWQRVGHLPGAILINCGETLNIWTDEKYHALQHRVVIPNQEHLRARGRHCIAFFCHPDNETMISPADIPNQCAAHDSDTKQPQKKYAKATEAKVYNALELVQRRFNETYGS